MADIFLSYARPNAREANRIAEALTARGYSVWYDADLPAHRSYAEVIEEQLEAASSVVVLWSKDSVGSQWVRSEANRARETGRLIQARIDDARLPMPFDQIQCADLAGAGNVEDAVGWRTLLRSIVSLAPEPMPPRIEPKERVATPGPAPTNRRGVLIGAGAGVAVAAAGGGWWLLKRSKAGPPISPRTAALMEQARAALWQNAREGQNQAIAIYRQIVDDNPTFADAWGRLAVAYGWTSHWRQASEGEMLRSRARSAAERALTLDDGNVHAKVGQACANPYLGNWGKALAVLRPAIAKAPNDPETSLSLGFVLALTGQNREASEHLKRVLAAGGPTPGIYIYYAQMLWGAGRQEEMDKALQEGRGLYPTHLGIWFTRFYSAMFDGRVGEALAMGADKTNWPTNVEPEEIESVIRVAKAIDSRTPAEVDAVSKEWMKRAHDGAGYAENSAQFLAALGRIDEAFTILRAYYFSEGFDCGENRFSSSQGTFTPRNDRLTYFLFHPSLAPLRGDARFAALIRDLKLVDYWRASGSKPDYLA